MLITFSLSSSVAFLPSSLPALSVGSIGIPKLAPASLQTSSLHLTGYPLLLPSTATPPPEPPPPTTYRLDSEQFTGITSGLVLALMLLAAILISQMRRP